jgi:outer membrane lipoprotein-sorting protein
LKRRIILIILIAGALLVLWAAPAAHGEDDVDAVLAGMENFWSGVETFSADFRQEKRLALFSDTLSSTGTLLFQKPERMIWRYDPPDDTVMSLSPGKVVFYFPGLNQGKIIYLSGGEETTTPSFMGFGVGGGIGEMTDRFSVTVTREGNIIEATFVPKEDVEGGGIERVIVRVDEVYMPLGTTFVEAGGDMTELVFSNQLINIPLDADAFEVEFPPGTSVETIGAGE